MAIPSAEQCTLTLSFDMVAKTMTVALQAVLDTWTLLSYSIVDGTLVDPLGNSVDITDILVEDGTGTFSQTFPAPVDSITGNVVNGEYKIFLPSVTVNDDTSPVTYTNVDSSYTLNYSKPEIVIEQVIKCANPASFVSTDKTNWNQFNPDGSTVIPADGANYAHNLHYPVGSVPPDSISPPTETADISITRGPGEFFNGYQTSSVTRDLTWTFADGLVVTDTVFGNKGIDVDCDNQMCSVACGLTKLYDTFQANKDTTQGNLNKDTMILAAAEAFIAYLNINCGNPQKANEMAIVIKKQMGGCCDDCDKIKSGTPVTGY